MWAMGLLPLLVAISVGLGTFRFALQAQALADEVCRRVALETQSSLALNLSALEALNPPARALRLSRTAAEVALNAALATGIPPVIAAARARLLTVQIAQRGLQARQLAIKWQSRAMAHSAPAKIRHDRLATLRGMPLDLKHPGLSVSGSPRTSPTPDYQPTSDFSRAQAATFHVRVDLLERAPTWLKRWFAPSAWHQHNCSATLSKENGKWQARLSEDKFSSRRFGS